MITVFHVSDLHFGWPAVPEQIEAIEEIIQKEKFDVVAISDRSSGPSAAAQAAPPTSLATCRAPQRPRHNGSRSRAG